MTATKISVRRRVLGPIISLTIRISETRAVKMGLGGDDLPPRFFLKKSLPYLGIPVITSPPWGNDWPAWP
jgi:hypothetical protein